MKTSINLFLIFLVILLLTLSLKSNVLAHVPLDTSGPASKEEPIFIEDHQISWAAYNQLNRPEDVDYYSFNANQGEEIYFSMVIPVIDRYQNFKPDVALIGSGIENDYAGYARNYIKSRLKPEPEENLIIVRDNKDNPDIFFEPFTRTAYWERQEFSITTPETGTYYLAVFSGDHDLGKYTLAIGRKEVWGINDLIRLPKIWWDTRIFAEKESSTYFIAGLGIAITSFIIYKFILKK